MSFHVPSPSVIQKYGVRKKESSTQLIFIGLNENDRSLPSRLVSRTPWEMLVFYEVNAPKTLTQQMTNDLVNQAFQICTEKVMCPIREQTPEYIC